MSGNVTEPKWFLGLCNVYHNSSKGCKKPLFLNQKLKKAKPTDAWRTARVEVQSLETLQENLMSALTLAAPLELGRSKMGTGCLWQNKWMWTIAKETGRNQESNWDNGQTPWRGQNKTVLQLIESGMQWYGLSIDYGHTWKERIYSQPGPWQAGVGAQYFACNGKTSTSGSTAAWFWFKIVHQADMKNHTADALLCIETTKSDTTYPVDVVLVVGIAKVYRPKSQDDQVESKNPL